MYRRRTVFTTESRRACGEVHAKRIYKDLDARESGIARQVPYPGAKNFPRKVRPIPAQRAELSAKRSRRQREGPYRQDEVRQSRGLATRPPHPNCVYVPVAIAGRVATAQPVGKF